MDATHASDGNRVMIKVVSRVDNEISIARYLTRNDLLRDPMNHCVPIFDAFDDPIDPSRSLMVMKYLRPFNDPEFRAVGEVIDFIHQTLEVRFYRFNFEVHTDFLLHLRG